MVRTKVRLFAYILVKYTQQTIASQMYVSASSPIAIVNKKYFALVRKDE